MSVTLSTAFCASLNGLTLRRLTTTLRLRGGAGAGAGAGAGFGLRLRRFFTLRFHTNFCRGNLVSATGQALITVMVNLHGSVDL